MARDFQIKNDDGDDLEPVLLFNFELLIRDRFPNIKDYVKQRLARAMILRRKRVLNRRHRQRNVATRPLANNSMPPTMFPTARETHPAVAGSKIAPSRTQPATTLDPEKYKTASSIRSSASSRKTIPTRNHEALDFPPVYNFFAKRKYDKAKHKGTPNSDLQALGGITCPYCLCFLPADEAFDEKKWQ